MKQNSYLPFVFLFIMLSACAAEHETMASKDGSYTITGTMHHLEVEGGCWQFRSENGRNYQLLGQEVSGLLHDGLRAKLIVRDTESVASICMVGKLVEVVEVIETEE